MTWRLFLTFEALLLGVVALAVFPLWLGQTYSPFPYFPGILHGQQIHNLPVADPWAAGALSFALDLLVSKLYGSGMFPFWDPYAMFGMPLWANPQAETLFPLQLLIHALPLRFWDLLPIARLMLAGTGIYLWLEALDLPFWPRSFAAFLYPLSGAFFLYINLDLTNILAVAPFSLWAIEQLRKEKTWGTVILSFSLGLNLLGGMPELSFTTGGVILLYLFVRLRKKWLGFALLAYVLGFMLAAIGLIPFLFYLGAASTPNGPGIGQQALSLSYLLGLISPHYLPPLGTAYTAWLGTYLGIVPLFLAFSALFFLKDRGSYILGLLAALILLKAFGFAGLRFLGLLPLFKQLIFPRYTLPLLSLFLPYLVARTLMASSFPRKRATGLGLVLLILLSFFQPNLHEVTFLLMTAVIAILWLPERFRVPLLGSLAVVNLLWLMPNPQPPYEPLVKPAYVTYLQNHLPQGGRVLAADNLLGLNLGGYFHIPTLMAFSPMYPKGSMRYIEAIDPNGLTSTYAYQGQENPSLLRTPGVLHHNAPPLDGSILGGLWHQKESLLRLADVQSLLASVATSLNAMPTTPLVYPKHIVHTTTSLLFWQGGILQGLSFDVTAAKGGTMAITLGNKTEQLHVPAGVDGPRRLYLPWHHVLAPGNQTIHFHLAKNMTLWGNHAPAVVLYKDVSHPWPKHTIDGVKIYENSGAYPPLFFTNQLTKTPPNQLPALLRQNKVQMLRMSTNTIDAKLVVTTSSYLIISQAASPGWHATINQKPVRIKQVFGPFMAIHLAKGKYALHLQYTPPKLLLALILSLLGFMITLFMPFVIKRFT